MTRIWLSVDWDYFCRQPKAWWHNGTSEKLGANPITWTVRATLSRIYGTEIRPETALSHASPLPGRFWQALERLGLRLDKVKVIRVAESHKDAYGVFRGRDTANVKLVHFDAHHDLLYTSGFAMESVVKGKVDCGNWHLLTLLRYPKLRSVIIYPRWKGWSEWQKTLRVLREVGPKGEEAIRLIKRQTRANVWPNVKLPMGDVEKIFICRSGAWTPPWHDKAFIRFVEGCEETCDLLSNLSDWETYDKLAPRPFSWGPVRKMAALEAYMLHKSV
jgi:hypothetical protein